MGLYIEFRISKIAKNTGPDFAQIWSKPPEAVENCPKIQGENISIEPLLKMCYSWTMKEVSLFKKERSPINIWSLLSNYCCSVLFKIEANFELNGKAKVCVQGVFHTLETRIILKKRMHFIHDRSRGQRKTNGELMVYWRGLFRFCHILHFSKNPKLQIGIVSLWAG